jgi:hypothetical protein
MFAERLIQGIRLLCGFLQPAVSIDAGQLAVDLLICTLGVRRVGLFGGTSFFAVRWKGSFWSFIRGESHGFT